MKSFVPKRTEEFTIGNLSDFFGSFDSASIKHFYRELHEIQLRDLRKTTDCV